MYIYIYIYVCIIYIYIYISSPPWINKRPPYLFCFLQTTFFTIHLLSNRPDIYKFMAKTLLIICSPSWGDPFARIAYGICI